MRISIRSMRCGAGDEKMKKYIDDEEDEGE